MAALDAAPPPANMLRRFFKSCFNKRPDSTPPHLQASTETDSSDATLVPPHSPPHSSSLTIRDRMRATGKGKAAASEAQSPAAKTPTMPKAPKEKKAAQSTKDRKPYTKAARYYNDNQNHGGSIKADAAARAQLNKFFDDLIPDEEKARSSEPISEIGAEQSMAYLERLEVNMANYELFVVLEIVKAESIGTITRSGFVDGWARIIAETKITPDWDGQQQYVRGRIAQALVDDSYFKTLYDFAFQVGREPPQKAIGMAVAVSFWEGLYEPNTNQWRSAHVNWLDQWTAYLREKYGVAKVNEDGEEEVEYKRTVSKDLWTQTRLFAIKTMKDETLGFWSEEQAWPGIIDDFVLWCREKGIVKEKKPEDAMEAE